MATAIVSQQQMQQILGYIEAGKSGGAQLIAGGKRAAVGNGNGFFVEPTISAA